MVGTGEKIAMDCFGEALNLAAPPAARGGSALLAALSSHFFQIFF